MEPTEKSTSFWKDDAGIPEAPPLGTNASADVCIIGAGITGMSCAYRLARSGAKVIVLERGPLGSGETGQTTAHLASVMDDRFDWLERLFGTDGAKLAYESHAGAIDTIESIVQKEAIDCDFERLDGFLFLGPKQSPSELKREHDAAKRIGFKGLEGLRRAPLPSFDTGPCLRFPRQGAFHPLRYLAGLRAAVLRDGGVLHSGAHVDRVEGGDAPRVLTQNGLQVSARSVIVATNSPINDRFAIHTKQAPYRSFVVGLEVPLGSVPRGLYWDMEDPYHYVRLQSLRHSPNTELLIVGGEDHKTGEHDDAEERYSRLVTWTRERFPMVGKVLYRWSGQVMETIDGLGFIGADPEHEKNVYIATGDSGQGMTHGTIASMIIPELIAGREHPWAKLYDPTRKTFKAVREFARENLSVAGHFAEWLGGGDVKSADDVPRGKGAIVQRGVHKLAVYRDEQGQVHERSAVCTHLGCIVHWNSEESSWDCPCHGSRFSPHGEVLSGPATSALAAAPGDKDDERPKAQAVRENS
jgi:glycine/D-amino acid oxidase-like deaminating enzyme/nitrite reductase/ring-hydroxylating ferredoxin subunit